MIKNFTHTMILLALGALTSTVFGYDCNSRVLDDSHFLKNPSALNDSIDLLVRTGVQPRVIVLPDLRRGGNLKAAMLQVARSCPSWQTNAVLFGLAPKAGKTDIIPGDNWSHVLTLDRKTEISDKEMVPRFKGRDFEGGLVAGMRQVNRVIEESQNAHAAPQTLLHWSLALLAIGSLGVFLVWLIFRFKREKENLHAAQQDALIARNKVSSTLGSLLRDADDYEILKGPNVDRVKSLLSDVASSYKQLTSGSATNPEEPGLTMAQYNVIKDQFEALMPPLSEASRLMKQTTTSNPSPDPASTSPSSTNTTSQNNSTPSSNTDSGYSAPPPPSYPRSRYDDDYYRPSYNPGYSSNNIVIVENNSPVYNEDRVVRETAYVDDSSRYTKKDSDDSASFGSSGYDDDDKKESYSASSTADDSSGWSGDSGGSSSFADSGGSDNSTSDDSSGF